MPEHAAICEAVFRYQFAQNDSVAQDAVSYYFLECGDRQDPPASFLVRFSGHSPRVLPASAAVADLEHGVRHKQHGDRGLIFRATNVRWVDAETAEVEGGYYEAGLSSSGNRYRVQRQHGAWVVVRDTLLWIS